MNRDDEAVITDGGGGVSDLQHGVAGDAVWVGGRGWVRSCLCGREFVSEENWEHVPALYEHLIVAPYRDRLFAALASSAEREPESETAHALADRIAQNALWIEDVDVRQRTLEDVVALRDLVRSEPSA